MNFNSVRGHSRSAIPNIQELPKKRNNIHAFLTMLGSTVPMLEKVESVPVENLRTYESLTLDQRIGLKGEFETNPKCNIYATIQTLWNFKIAVEYFLNDDISILQKNSWKYS